MKINLNPEQVVTARVALVVLHSSYVQFAEKAQTDDERTQMSQYADIARAMKERLITDGEFEMSQAEVVLFEHACRMSARASQIQIKPKMDRGEHAVLIAEVKEATDLLTAVRKAKGLPW